MSKRIAIVTGEDRPGLTEGGRQLRRTFRQRGHEAEAVVWTESGADRTDVDVALLRSCWGYYTRPERFRRWIEAAERAGTVVLNPPSVVRWNLHKSYLLDLEAEGVPIVPTEVVAPDDDRRLEAILRDRGWDEAVVKPTIGTSAAGVWRTSRGTAAADQGRFESRFPAGRRVGDSAGGDDGELLSERGAIVQRFVPAVADGEASLVFLGGEFSHAWRSHRASDALGVEPTADGGSAPLDPSPSLVDRAAEAVAAAGEVLGTAPSGWPYARVDVVGTDDGVRLMELELIEPHLRLLQTDSAVEVLASAVESAVGRTRGTV